MFGSTVFIVIILVTLRQKRIISIFRNTGTLLPSTSKTFQELGLVKSLVLFMFIKRKVLIEAASNHYYLDEDNLHLFLNKRRKRLLVFVLILALLVLVEASVNNFYRF